MKTHQGITEEECLAMRKAYNNVLRKLGELKRGSWDDDAFAVMYALEEFCIDEIWKVGE